LEAPEKRPVEPSDPDLLISSVYWDFFAKLVCYEANLGVGANSEIDSYEKIKGYV